jgi:hypothetical protein
MTNENIYPVSPRLGALYAAFLDSLIHQQKFTTSALEQVQVNGQAMLKYAHSAQSITVEIVEFTEWAEKRSSATTESQS